jgi:hypothetical protein
VATWGDGPHGTGFDTVLANDLPQRGSGTGPGYPAASERTIDEETLPNGGGTAPECATLGDGAVTTMPSGHIGAQVVPA